MMSCPTNLLAAENISTTFLPREESVDLFSEKTLHILTDVFNGYIASIICLVGIPANLVTCSVFWRQGLRDRMNLCLFCLAAVDLLYLLAALPLTCLGAFLYIARSALAEEYGLKILIYGLWLVYGLRATSGCYNMIIAVERCVCVVFPLKAASLLQTRTMGVLLAVCYFLIQFGYTVIPLMYRVTDYDEGGRQRWHFVPTQMFLDNKDLFEAVELTVLTVSLPITTFLVVSVTAVITVIKLTAALKWREKTSSTRREKAGHQTALTKMILLVSFIYICSMLPTVSLSITRLLVDGFSPDGRYYNLFMGSHIVANICPLAHSASNFFIYYNRSSRFKSALTAMCQHIQNSTHLKERAH